MLGTFCMALCIFSLWSRNSTAKMTEKALKLAFMVNQMKGANGNPVRRQSYPSPIPNSVLNPTVIGKNEYNVMSGNKNAAYRNLLQLAAPEQLIYSQSIGRHELESQNRVRGNSQNRKIFRLNDMNQLSLVTEERRSIGQ